MLFGVPSAVSLLTCVLFTLPRRHTCQRKYSSSTAAQAVVVTTVYSAGVIVELTSIVYEESREVVGVGYSIDDDLSRVGLKVVGTERTEEIHLR
jgi:hypothetical protein